MPTQTIAGYALESVAADIAPGGTVDFEIDSDADEFILSQLVIPSTIGDNVEVLAILNADGANVLSEPHRGSWFAEYRPAPNPHEPPEQGPYFTGKLLSDSFTVRVKNLSAAPISLVPKLIGIAVT